MRRIRVVSAAVLMVALLLSLVSPAAAYPHPGGLTTGSEFTVVKSKVDADTSPWAEAYDRMMLDANQGLSVTGNAIATLNIPGYYANPSAHDAAKLRLEIDAQAAYATAVAYRLTGDTVYADKARDLLNNWSYTNTSVTGTDGRLVSAYIGVGLINAADLIKDYPGWSAADKTQFGSWLTGVLIPIWDTITFTSNWRDWSLYAQIAAYQFLDNETAMASEVNQLKTQIDVSIREDGFLPDETTRGTNSLWYHYFALGPMTAAAEIVKNATGEDLYHWVSPSGKSIKLALDNLFYYVNGNVSAWPPAYGGGNQTFSNARNLYEAMAEVYQDAEYEEYVGSSRPLVGRINYTSGYYHNHAWVYPTLLRTSIPDLPEGGLAGYWKFDETAGTTAADSSGNGLDGTLSGGPVWTTGHTNNALDFDGVDDYVSLGNPTKLRITGAMTLSAWVYVDSFTQSGRIIAKQGAANNRGWSLNVESGSGVASFQIATNSTTLQSVNTASAIPAGQWVHLAGVYEPGTALRIYVNGVLNNSNTSSIAAAQHNSSLDVNIGRRPTGELPFDGKIDEVRVYNKALSAGEVGELAASAVPGLAGYWKFDETTGTMAADSSGNGLSGTLYNGPVWTTGHTNNALDFDGVNDFVDLGNPAELRLTGAMTLSAWVYVDSFTQSGRIIAKQGAANNRGWSLNVESGSGVASFQIAANSTTLQSVNTASAIPSGQWVHLAGVYEPGTALRIYVNGVLNNSNTSSIAPAQRNSGLNVNIGRRPTGELPFDGKIDEVRVYNRVLSAAEIAADM